MRPPLKKAMFHLAWSPDSLPTSEAIAPLLEYLDMHLVVLNSALLSVNFQSSPSRHLGSGAGRIEQSNGWKCGSK